MFLISPFILSAVSPFRSNRIEFYPPQRKKKSWRYSNKLSDLSYSISPSEILNEKEVTTPLLIHK